MHFLPNRASVPNAAVPNVPMIHRWYRSQLFWLGLPGLLFLLWAWLPATGFTLTWVRAEDELELAVGGGSIHGTYQRYMVPRSHSFGAFWLRPTGLYLAKREGRHRLFPVPFSQIGIRGATWADTITVAIWFLLILYLLTWLGLFRLSRRRDVCLPESSSYSP